MSNLLLTLIEISSLLFLNINLINLILEKKKMLKYLLLKYTRPSNWYVCVQSKIVCESFIEIEEIKSKKKQ